MKDSLKSWQIRLALLVTILGVFLSLTRLIFFTFSPFQPRQMTSVLFEIHKGQSPSEIIKSLTTNGIIKNGRYFLWVGRLGRQWRKIKAGEYRLSASMAPWEIYSLLTSGISAAHPLTVREGENIYEIGENLESKGLMSQEHFVSLCKDKELISSLPYFKDAAPPTLEGYLFPDTYFFNRTLSEVDIIKQMVHHFFKIWNNSDDERAKTLGLSRHEIITLASIIEKETGASEERPLISSIFHNRLQKHMKLQSDPTTIYGMWDHYHGKIHKKDLSAKNEYNTYYVNALPIGPIGNPGEEAIRAALYPSSSPYLYFVSHNDGTHQFSKTIQEHNQAVKKFQLNPQARVGKSWRDHLKKTSSTQTTQ